MYKPDSKMKKLLAAKDYRDNISAAYVWPDGIVLVEERTVPIGEGYNTTVRIRHAFATEVTIRRHALDDNYRCTSLPVDYVYMYQPAILFYGVQSIVFTTAQGTEAMKAHNVTTTACELITADGIRTTSLEIIGMRGGPNKAEESRNPTMKTYAAYIEATKYESDSPLIIHTPAAQ